MPELVPDVVINALIRKKMPPRFWRCCAFAKAVLLIRWGFFAVFCICSMVLFIPVVIWGKNGVQIYAVPYIDEKDGSEHYNMVIE